MITLVYERGHRRPEMKILWLPLTLLMIGVVGGASFERVPFIGELSPVTEYRFSNAVSLSTNGQDVVVGGYRSEPFVSNNFYWNRRDDNIVLPSQKGFSSADERGWVSFRQVSSPQTIGGIYFDGPRGDTHMSRIFLATATPEQAVSGDGDIYELSGFGGDDDRPTGLLGLAGNTAWVTTDSVPNHPIDFSRIDLATLTQETFFEAMTQSGVENPGNLTVKSTVSGPDANTLVMNVHSPGRTMVFSWSTTGLIELPRPDSLLEEDDDVFEATTVSSDGSFVGGFINFNGDTRARGVPFVWQAAEGGYEMRGLECSTAGAALDPKGCVILGNDGSLIVGAGQHEQSEKFLALAWLPDAKQATPISSVLRTAGLAQEIDGWEFHTVEAMSPDGGTMVGFGLDPQGVGSMWLASVPEELSFETVILADFDGNGKLEANDIDLLSDEILQVIPDARFDLDNSLEVDGGDLSYMVETVLKTWSGDATLDGEFNSGDLGRGVFCGAIRRWRSNEFRVGTG